MRVTALSSEGQGTRFAPLTRRLRSGGETFLNTLRRTGTGTDQPSAVKTVQSGDTLWGICAACLGEQGLSASNGSIHEAVQRVTRSNGLENPDLILPGQQIRLDAIQRGPRTPSPGGARVGQSVSVPPLMPRGMTMSELATRQRLMESTDTSSEQLGALSPVKSRLPLDEYGQLSAQSPWSQILGAPARLTSEFGMRKDPFTGTMRQHDGIDLAAPSGTKIYPVAPGRVAFSGWQGGYGQVVVVKHADGSESVYGHTSQNLVKEGQRVITTTPIGAVGSTGRSTGPHLHFELRRGGRAVDPIHALTSGSIHVAQAL
ncbi:MAG: peptidoglycan DD-metalloendopeptidase family protein [bacterium]|nr:peptidoglycan DD-metalloendopeptidase family protein [bacterium]